MGAQLRHPLLQPGVFLDRLQVLGGDLGPFLVDLVILVLDLTLLGDELGALFLDLGEAGFDLSASAGLSHAAGQVPHLLEEHGLLLIGGLLLFDRLVVGGSQLLQFGVDGLEALLQAVGPLVQAIAAGAELLDFLFERGPLGGELILGGLAGGVGGGGFEGGQFLLFLR